MFEVVWIQRSVDELADEWLSADSFSRRLISTAARQIDERLRDDPNSLGESRGGEERIHFVDPLGFTFRVNATDRTVYVLQVWRIDRRRRKS
jgi:hypothetical protein